MKQLETKYNYLECQEEKIESTTVKKIPDNEQIDNKIKTNYILALDIETSGSYFLKNGTLSIGASLQDSDSIEKDFFQFNLLLDQHSYDKECKETFWDKFTKAQKFIETNALHPKKAMQNFAAFLSKIDIQYSKVIMISDNPSFDIAWLHYYLSIYTDAKSLRYSSVDNTYRMVWDSVSVQKTW